MSRNKKLVTNTFLFFLSNFGSKFLSFILVPFYTAYLSTDQYGTIDLVVVTTSLLVPVATLCASDAVLRFASEKSRDSSDVYQRGIIISIIGNLVAIVPAYIVSYILKINEYFLFMVIIMITSSLCSINKEYCRSVGKTLIFAIDGIIQTLVLVSCNILFLVIFSLGIAGYFYSIILSNIISIIYLMISAKLYKLLFTKTLFKPQISLTKEMISYSTPLVPNTISWWIMNASDKLVIAIILGTSFNGLYAVANKLPSIINLCNVIFFQAWQLSAIEEVKSKDRDEYYSKMYNFLSTVIFTITSLLMVLLRPLFSIWVAADYYEAWQATPFLFISMIFLTFSSFWGTNFVAIKNTKSILKSTVFGAAINLLLNFLLIPQFKLYGAAFATAVGFFVTWIIRVIDSKKTISIFVNWKLVTIQMCILGLQYYFMFNKYFIIIECILFLCTVIVNLRSIVVILNRIILVTKGFLRKKAR